ncbi:MAG TPA: F0F1 ATP synthase subunit A [Anaerolineae bacterium]|nr:F0F1 ATP synthase subunit A [Anaerolineae bacterium]
MSIEEELVPRLVFVIGPVEVTSTVVTTWLIVAFLGVATYLIGRNLEVRPGVFQNIVEWVVESIDGLLQKMIGGESRLLSPFVGTLAIFIAVANLTGLVPGLKAPTTDINTPLALALIVFASVHYYGIRHQGLLGHLKHYVEPIFLMLPIEVVGELARTLSLTFRLFGNMLGEEIVVSILFLVLPLLVPVPMMIFGIFTGFIQAYIFTILTITYLAGAVRASQPKQRPSER